MTYRGIYRDGIIQLEGEVELRNGSHVEVNIVPSKGAKGRAPSRPKATRKNRKSAPQSLWEREAAKARKMTGQERLAVFRAAFGMYKDRPDWKGKTSVQIASELRARTSSRTRHNG